LILDLARLTVKQVRSSIGAPGNSVTVLLQVAAYAAQVRQPINADGSSVFNASKGVVPVRFTLTLGNVSTCNLPSANVVVTRTSGECAGVYRWKRVRDVGG